jgi:hypothetical protein
VSLDVAASSPGLSVREFILDVVYYYFAMRVLADFGDRPTTPFQPVFCSLKTILLSDLA